MRFLAYNTTLYYDSERLAILIFCVKAESIQYILSCAKRLIRIIVHSVIVPPPLSRTRTVWFLYIVHCTDVTCGRNYRLLI